MRCALCLAPHSNTVVCDDCASIVAADIDRDPEGVGTGAAETLRAVLRLAGCDVVVRRIDEVRAFMASTDVSVVPWDRDYTPMGEVTP
jgi:hypothetical protein